MPIIKWRPFKELEKPFGRGLEDLFDHGEEWMPFVPTLKIHEPAIDIYQDKNNLYLEMPLVGLKPENVNISIDDNVLTIEGKAEEKEEVKDKDYFRKEIRRGSFRRTVKLPVEVKSNQAKAEVERGLLKITIPKVAKATPRTKRIPIKIK